MKAEARASSRRAALLRLLDPGLVRLGGRQGFDALGVGPRPM